MSVWGLHQSSIKSIFTSKIKRNIVKYLSTILLTFFLTQMYGQERTAYDSLSLDIESRLDSLQHLSIDSIPIVNKTLTQIDASNALLSYQLDSISTLKVRDQKIDSLKQAARHKLDSMKLLDLPHEQYLVKVDSLNKKLESEVEALKQQADQKVRDWKSKLTEKLGTDSLGLGMAGLPDATRLPAAMDLPDMDEKFSLYSPRELEGLDDLEIAPAVQSPLESNERLDQLRAGTDRLMKTPQGEIEKIKGREEVERVAGGLGQIKALGTQVEEYNHAFAKAKEGNMEDLENKVGEEVLKRSEIDYLSKEAAKVENLKEQHARLLKDAEQYQDKEMVIQRIKEKSKHLAVRHLPKDVDYKSRLAAAQKKLAANKKKYGELRSLQDTLLKKTNPLKGQPLKKRLRPGFDLEIARSQDPFMDIAPFIGYRLNDRWSVYASYVYRFILKQDGLRSTDQAPTYGGRLYSTFDVFKGFSVMAATDYLRTNVPLLQPGEHRRQWVPGWYGGIGKMYNFSRQVKGTVQLLYNFHHQADSPFSKKFNVRMGFQLDLSKKPKKPEINLRMDDFEIRGSN